MGDYCPNCGAEKWTMTGDYCSECGYPRYVEDDE
jgi:ribosomal protein L37E